MKMRIIGIGIVAVALILAISMTASAKPDPVGADVTVETNSVMLGYFNGTADAVTYHDGVALSTKQAQGDIYCKAGAVTSTGGSYVVEIAYTDVNGAPQTVTLTHSTPAPDEWVNLSEVTDLVNITGVTWTSADLTTVYDATIYAILSKQTAAQGTAESDAAEGGYITEMDMTGDSQTVKWQGYYGDITGSVRLADANGDYMYTWAWSAGTGGAVFAVARSTMPNFGVVDTNNPTVAQADTALEIATWSGTGTDNVTATLTGTNSAAFYVAGNTIDLGSRNATYTLKKTDNLASEFEEVLLADRAVDTVDDMIWTCLIVDQAEDYTGGNSDYQMIVPATDIGGGTTTYYFYVELL